MVRGPVGRSSTLRGEAAPSPERSPAARRSTNSGLAAAARPRPVRAAGRAVGARGTVAVGRHRVDEGQRGDLAVEREGGDRRAAGRPAHEVDGARRPRVPRAAPACRRPSRAGRGWRRSAAAPSRRSSACRARSGDSGPVRPRTGARRSGPSRGCRAAARWGCRRRGRTRGSGCAGGWSGSCSRSSGDHRSSCSPIPTASRAGAPGRTRTGSSAPPSQASRRAASPATSTQVMPP